ncbi:uncharacterized protein [Drosophila kikkawai]|uniref:Uncharacterized protein n=1 Tax=Drosophila kikkawai TaxID=30033 RepID=A0A6P4J811_DROKI|nr:uncharacterized protein LOC108080836 [Drosophila kikkawai]
MLATYQIHQQRPETAKIVVSTNSSLDQFYHTLQLCLRFAPDGNDVFNHLISCLERFHFIPMLDRMAEAELRRVIPMLSQKLKGLRLPVSSIPKLHAICQQMDVSHLVSTRYCVLLGEEDGRNAAAEDIELLGEVLPNLEILHVFCSIQGYIPVLKKVRILSLVNASQATLDGLLQKCPQLEHFMICHTSDFKSVYDMENIRLCKLIKDLLLPFQVKTPLAIGHLANLRHLSLESKRLWAESAWLPTVLAIIKAKRFALERLTFDGTWLVGPLIVSKLELTQCTALRELRLSNCKVDDGVGCPLPLICQKLSFRRCTLNKVYGFLATQQMLRHLELFECQVQWTGPLIRKLIGLSMRRLGPKPLHFQFSQSTRLRSEYTKLEKEELAASKPWIQVREVEPPQSETWKQPPGTITMEFGRPIDHLPNVQLPVESIPVAADLLKELY